ncbi:MAG: lysyl oxidase family protein, partial [Gaiellaceae bacterium]
SGPSWSPDGRRLVVAAGDGLRIVTVESGASEPLAGTSGAGRPAWSPDGTRIAFQREGDVWTIDLRDGSIARLTSDPAEDREPAWTPDGARIGFASARDANLELYAMAADGSAQTRLTSDPAADGSPAFSPDGRRLAFVRDGVVLLAGADGSLPRALGPGADPAWARIPPPPPPPPADELLPDLDQRAPSGLTVASSRGRFLLGFTSATDNVGAGPIRIRGSRPRRTGPMTASQLIRLRNGRTRVVRDVGRMRYAISYPHRHWHLLRFQSYELRRASDFAVLVRDRKSGFCLADHYGLARGRVRAFGPPRFLESCGSGRPDLLSVEHGTSVGYTDRYPAHFHGQNVDVSGVPPGIYVLVHRANPSGRLREGTLANNAASVRLRLSWPYGRRHAPRVRVLRVCGRSERC